MICNDVYLSCKFYEMIISLSLLKVLVLFQCKLAKKEFQFSQYLPRWKPSMVHETVESTSHEKLVCIQRLAVHSRRHIFRHIIVKFLHNHQSRLPSGPPHHTSHQKYGVCSIWLELFKMIVIYIVVYKEHWVKQMHLAVEILKDQMRRTSYKRVTL